MAGKESKKESFDKSIKMKFIRRIKHFILVMILLSGFDAFSQDYLEKYLSEDLVLNDQ